MEHRTQNNQYGIQDTGRSAFRVPRSAQAGMSLLELLIYIAILSGLMVVISDAFIMLAKGRGQAEARSEVNSAVRFAAERIKQDVKNAGAISTPVLGTPANTLSLGFLLCMICWGGHCDALKTVLSRRQQGAWFPSIHRPLHGWRIIIRILVPAAQPQPQCRW